MRVLFVRHGPAIDPRGASFDEARWLTAEGRRRVRRVAGALVELDVAPTAIYASHLVRAVQTAEILAAAQPGFDSPVEVLPALSPERGTTAQALAPLDEASNDAVLFFVGHEPKIRALAGHLTGVGGFPAFKAGAACLVTSDGHSGRFEWMMDPETLALARSLDAIGR